MSRERIDSESLPGLEALLSHMPGGLNAIRDIGERRRALARFLRAAQADIPANENVYSEDVVIPGLDGCSEIALRVYRPLARSETRSAVYYIHGGGMVMGSISDDAPLCAMLCETLNVMLVAVEYRLAPEHPYPAALHDCVAGIRWLAGNAAELGIDAGRLAVYGGSAGGNLAIATALYLQDQGGPAVRFVAAPYPMLDDRNEAPSSYEVTDVGIWDREGNREAWAFYLAGQPADGYAAPARRERLSGFPSTFIDVGEVDLFRDECISFAARLLQAGTAVELHVHPGAYHGSEIFSPDAALSQRIWARRLEALASALN